MVATLKLLSHLIFVDKSSIKFVIGIIFGLAFSMTTILGTIGIMDSFIYTLRSALKDSNGDITIQSRYGFFKYDETIQKKLERIPGIQVAKVIKSQGFAINDELSKGVLIVGMNPITFNQVTGLKMAIDKGDLAIGHELSRILSVKVGDYLVIGLASGNSEMKDLPHLKRMRIGQIIKHTIYQKDSRLVYIDNEVLAEMMRMSVERVNGLIIGLEAGTFKAVNQDNEKKINEMVQTLRNEFGYDYVVKAYWQEFGSFLKAVQAEKIMISLILQLIVVISVVNILAFIIFLSEKRSREIFLFKAFGLGQKTFSLVWLKMVTILWSISCLVSLVMVFLLRVFLDHFTYFEQMKETYNLESLSLLLEIQDYFLVFVLALLWIWAIAWWGLRRMRKKSLLESLRREFA